MISIAGKNSAKGKREELGSCSSGGCGESASLSCEYCGGNFCRQHIKAKPSSLAGLLRDNLSDAEKSQLDKDSGEQGGHSCAPYFDAWLEKKKGKSKETETGPAKPKAQHAKAAAKAGKEKEPAKRKRGIPKNKIIFSVLLGLIALAAFYMNQDNSIVQNVQSVLQIPLSCADGTAADACSMNKPYYCFNATLMERSPICGCPEGRLPKGNSCGLPNSCIDKTESGQCSSRKPYFCLNGKLTTNASLCGCPEYVAPEWVSKPPTWNISSPMLYSNSKWYTNNLTYTISKNCSKIQRENMVKAINYVSSNTNTSLTFVEVEDGCPQITVKCLNVTQSTPLEQGVAETVLTKRNEGYYSVITQAEITVTLSGQACSPPVTQIHQVLHALGLAHLNDGFSMLYEKFGCTQTLKNQTKNDLAQIYPRI